MLVTPRHKLLFRSCAFRVLTPHIFGLWSLWRYKYSCGILAHLTIFIFRFTNVLIIIIIIICNYFPVFGSQFSLSGVISGPINFSQPTRPNSDPAISAPWFFLIPGAVKSSYVLNYVKNCDCCAESTWQKGVVSWSPIWRSGKRDVCSLYDSKMETAVGRLSYWWSFIFNLISVLLFVCFLQQVAPVL